MLAVSRSRQIAYVSCAGSSEIAAFFIDPGKATLSPGPVTSVAKGASPISMPLAVAPDQRHLYAAVRSPPFNATGFSIRIDGRLDLLGTVPLEDSMAYLCTDRSGRWLLGASLPGSKLTVNAIDGTGCPGALAQSLATRAKVHSLIVDRSNRFAYAALFGADSIMQFRFDAASGALSANSPSETGAAPGSGPRHIRFHPEIPVVYVNTERAGTLQVFDMNPLSGVLTPRQTVSIVPPRFAEAPLAADMQITPDGRFLYASERASSTLSAFRIDPRSGDLTPIGVVDTEPKPRGVAIDKTGTLLLAAGTDSNRLAVFAIDPADGRLTATARHGTGPVPNWIEIVDLAGGAT